MAWAPISNTVPQYYASGAAASGYYLKFYQSGTTTATNMATDSTGGTTLAKCEINSAGYPVNGSGDVFIPHIDQNYKLALYTNATDADADTTANAVWVVDALVPAADNTKTIEKINSVAALIAGSWSALDEAQIISYYASWEDTAAGPKGGHYVHKTGANNTTPTVGTAVSVSSIGTGTQSGYYWDADGDEWYISRRNQEIDSLMFGVKADEATTDDTAALQKAVDFGNQLYLGGSLGGDGCVIKLPPGKIKYTGLTLKSGVSLKGYGKNKTLLMLSGATSTGIKCAAADTQSSADQLSWGEFQGFGMYSLESSPTSQIQWNAIGFSRWVTRDVFFEWFNGCTGISVKNATLAGSGGPAQWYNSFYDCHLLHLASTTAGGTALDLGDTDTGKEQVTTWSFFGGRVSASATGTGLALRGTGCKFYGMTFEGLTTACDIGSSGTRGAASNAFYGCYWEGNTTNRQMQTNATFTKFSGSFVTGGTDNDLASDTTFDDFSVYEAYSGSSGTQRWEVKVVNGGSRRPKFVGLNATPALGIENSAGTEVILANGAATSEATKYFRVFDDAFSTSLIEIGTSELTSGADGSVNVGSASNRYNTVYAATGTINTSDEREKTELLTLDDAEKAVAKEIKASIKKFKFKDSIRKKGAEAARVHFGVGAQTVGAIFEKHGLNPNDYALFCFDEWEDEFEQLPQEITTVDGKEVQKVAERTIQRTKAANRYGIRYDELLAFIVSAI